MEDYTKDLSEKDLYDLAVKRVKMKKDFLTHLVTYLAVNAFLLYIDLTYSGGTWFYFVLGAWGIGIVAHAIETYTSLKLTHNSKAVDKEIEKIRTKR